MTLFALGSNEDARDAALQVLEKQPENEEALLLFIDASRTPDNIADARKLIQSLRDKDQDRARYHLALGAIDLRQNDPTGAESEFKTALNLDPKSIEANAALGSFYWSRGFGKPRFLDLAKPRFLDLSNLRFLDYSDTISRLRVISSMLTPKRRATRVACSSVIGFRLAHNHNACVRASGLRDRCSCMCFRKAVKPSRFVALKAAV